MEPAVAIRGRRAGRYIGLRLRFSLRALKGAQELISVPLGARRTTSCKFTEKLIERADRSGILDISRLSVS